MPTWRRCSRSDLNRSSAPGRASQGIGSTPVDAIFDAVLAIGRVGVTALKVEQRLAESLSIVDRADVLQTGRVILRGSAAEVRDDPEVRRAGLGV